MACSSRPAKARSASGRFATSTPEVSWSVLWDKVWYEGYSEPEYIWQSSASSNEFEPKYSLVPLSFGTLKAASLRHALGGASGDLRCNLYPAILWLPAMRRKVKPLIELMEALPTVVLGFPRGFVAGTLC